MRNSSMGSHHEGSLHLAPYLIFSYFMEGRRNVSLLIAHSARFYLWLYGIKHMVEDQEDKGNVLFNDALNTFYLTVIWRWTYGK